MSEIKIILSRTFTVLLVSFLFLEVCLAQKTYDLSEEMKKETIASISKYLEEWYIFPDKGYLVAEGLRKNLESGNYSGITDPGIFADQLGEDMRSIHRDEHFSVRFAPDIIKRTLERQNSNEQVTPVGGSNKYRNNGFSEIKILEGNIGYIKIDKFISTKYSGSSAIAAMNFVMNCNALIFDLRENTGGDGSLLQLLISYLTDGSDIHLNTLEVRKDNISRQFWTLPYVPGTRMPDTDLYILTGKNTFSAAEEFCYDLQALKRATIVGERTYGGAHPVEKPIINEYYVFSIPVGRSVNPVTQSNWEGTGIIPDVDVSEGLALEKAHLLALQKLKDDETNPAIKESFVWNIETLSSWFSKIETTDKDCEKYTGIYGPRSITSENQTLYYQRGENARVKLIKISDGYFMLENKSDFRIRFIEENGRVTSLIGIYQVGYQDKSERTS